VVCSGIAVVAAADEQTFLTSKKRHKKEGIKKNVVWLEPVAHR